MRMLIEKSGLDYYIYLKTVMLNKYSKKIDLFFVCLKNREDFKRSNVIAYICVKVSKSQ